MASQLQSTETAKFNNNNNNNINNINNMHLYSTFQGAQKGFTRGDGTKQ